MPSTEVIEFFAFYVLRFYGFSRQGQVVSRRGCVAEKPLNVTVSRDRDPVCVTVQCHSLLTESVGCDRLTTLSDRQTVSDSRVSTAWPCVLLGYAFYAWDLFSVSLVGLSFGSQ
jgi:hypothetical protein